MGEFFKPLGGEKEKQDFLLQSKIRVDKFRKHLLYLFHMMRTKVGFALIIVVSFFTFSCSTGDGGGFPVPVSLSESSLGEEGQEALGVLDSSFNLSGYISYHGGLAGGGNENEGAIAIDSSGRILVTGSSDSDMFLCRYYANGTIDTSFGIEGCAIHNPLVEVERVRGSAEAEDIAIDPSGKILVVGWRNIGVDADLVIWRYNPDGTLDTSFGGKGYVVHNNAAGGNKNDFGRAITIDSSGKILVAGQSWGASGNFYDMVIWRYNPDGTLDTSFNGTGYVVHHNAAGGDGDDYGRDIAIDPSGRILVTGYSWNGTTYKMAIWCYSSNGSIDTTFGTNGVVTHSGWGFGENRGEAIAIDSSGKILVGGWGNGTSGYDMILWRYNSDGTIDTTFGSGLGFVSHNNAAGGNGNEYVEDIAIDSSGRILVAGSSLASGGDYDMVIWRYNPSGSLDTTFGGTGFITYNNAAGGNGNDYAVGILVDSSGKIVAGGHSDRDPTSGVNYDIVIWRYNSDGTLDTTFNGNGITTYDKIARRRWNDYARAIAVDSSGKILVTGHVREVSFEKGIYSRKIWQYNPDGSLDSIIDTGDGYGEDIILDSSGKILITGCSFAWNVGDEDMEIKRYNPTGTLDLSISHNNAAGGNGNDCGKAITIDSSERILVTGYSYNGANYDMVIWRYHSNGSLDTSFNGVGYVVHHNAAGGNGDDKGLDIAIDPSGKIVVVGYSKGTSGTYDMTIWRYNPDGTLDTSFGGGDGIVTQHNTAGGNGDEIGNALIIDPSGKILVTGYSQNISHLDMAIWRFHLDGSLDTSFNSPWGYALHNAAGGAIGNDVGNAITIGSSGRILVTGYSFNSLNYDMVIWQYTAEGRLDTSFGSGKGYVVHNNAAGGNGNDFGEAITIDSQGRILVAGYSKGQGYDMIVWRYK